METTFEQWLAGKISGFGSFHTSLLNTYKLADAKNRAILDKAFPSWFTNDSEVSVSYSKEHVADLLMTFASRLGQRDGQYLPTIQPCKDFIKENL